MNAVTLLCKLSEHNALKPGRSTYERGVQQTAIDLAQWAVEQQRYESADTGTPTDLTDDYLKLRRYFLNGADTWLEYSEGGCALIWTEDIAARYAPPSEIRRLASGEIAPTHYDRIHGTETWLELQAHGLHDAFRLIWRIIDAETHESSAYTLEHYAI